MSSKLSRNLGVVVRSWPCEVHVIGACSMLASTSAWSPSASQALREGPSLGGLKALKQIPETGSPP
jgi:hypothetical protein